MLIRCQMALVLLLLPGVMRSQELESAPSKPASDAMTLVSKETLTQEEVEKLNQYSESKDIFDEARIYAGIRVAKVWWENGRKPEALQKTAAMAEAFKAAQAEARKDLYLYLSYFSRNLIPPDTALAIGASREALKLFPGDKDCILGFVLSVNIRYGNAPENERPALEKEFLAQVGKLTAESMPVEIRADAFNSLGRLFNQKKDYANATLNFREARRLNPKRPIFIKNLGWAIMNGAPKLQACPARLDAMVEARTLLGEFIKTESVVSTTQKNLPGIDRDIEVLKKRCKKNG